MDDPRTMSPGSIMPMYPYMVDHDLNISTTAKKIRVMQTLGVPYPKDYDKIANEDLEKQALKIQASLKKDGIVCSEKKEIIALIAYLQRLGTDIKNENKADNTQ
jgi:cytochrome c oxidase cbb3-type subunit I/II